jgi:hypothetical protein
MSNSLAAFNGASPGRCGAWPEAATATAQGLSSRSTRRARDGDFHLAISGDFSMATSGDFGTATDRGARDPSDPYVPTEGRYTGRSLGALCRGLVPIGTGVRHPW